MTVSLYNNSESGAPEPTNRREALAAAVNGKGEYVLGYLFTLTRNSHLGEDLAQETWISVYRSFKTEHFTHLGFLKRKAYQVFVDYCRATKTRSFVQGRESLDNLPVEYVPKEQEGSEAEAVLKARFWSNFVPLELDPIDKESFWLIERYGYTIEEVSKRVKIPSTTLHGRLKRLKKACVARLTEECQ